jgi:DNA-binding NarL/FixJ family response regulator
MVYTMMLRQLIECVNPTIKYHVLRDDRELGRIGDINPDIAIVDYDLGDDCFIKGDQIVKMLKARLPDVIVVANSAMRNNNQVMINAGADIALEKGGDIIGLIK